MGFVKSAMMDVQAAGCLWIDADVIGRLRDAGHAPQTRTVTVEGFAGPVAVEALPASEGLRLLPLLAGEDRETMADALADLM